MQPLSPKKMVAFDIFIFISVIAAIGITVLCISRGIYEVFPYFYLIPVVLIAYARPKIGIYATVMLGWLYIALVYILALPDARHITLATIWFFILVSLGVLISTFSQEYRREGGKSCGAYDYSQAGAFTVDGASLRIVDANKRFAQMIGYKCDELLARTLCDIIPDDMERDVFLSRVHDHNRVGDIEVRLLSQDGSDCWVLASAAKTGDNIVVCTVVDITGIRQAQECLSQANRKLNLLNNITRHDVLNQLTILSSYISLCRDAAHDQKLLELIAKQERAAETIRSQILFTRDYQNIGIHSPEWFNVAQTVTSAVASIDLSRIRFAIDLPQLQIYADPLLEKVFYNLIDNSVRHGEHVTAISVSCREVTGGLELIVQDDGAGIPEDGKEKIFRREYFKNTGLGLFLSREILGITGITISETGTPGQGARFVICVPRGSYRYQ